MNKRRCRKCRGLLLLEQDKFNRPVALVCFTCGWRIWNNFSIRQPLFDEVSQKEATTVSRSASSEEVNVTHWQKVWTLKNARKRLFVVRDMEREGATCKC